MLHADNNTHKKTQQRPVSTETIKSIGKQLDELAKEFNSEHSKSESDHIASILHISKILEFSGRGLIYFSLDPFSYGLGIATLAAHKSIELMEIGHTSLHGAYNNQPRTYLHEKNFHWKAPIDEESWRRKHNVLHHQYTNTSNMDPDLDFGVLRLSHSVPHRKIHRLQPISNLVSWSTFALSIGLHVSEMIEVYSHPISTTDKLLDAFRKRKKHPQETPKKTAKKIITAHRRFLRKAIPYYTREFLLFPCLAGPFFIKIAIGNLLSEWLRDLLSASIIYCGHVGTEEVDSAERCHSRFEFYLAQIQRTRNVQVPPLISILVGGLDHQVEHHLFPRMPPHHLRAMRPHVKRICETHQIQYPIMSWSSRLGEVWKILAELRHPTNPRHTSLHTAT